MHFDLISFLIGFGVAAVIGIALYAYRRQIMAVRQTAESQAGTTRRFITSSAENRYYNDLVKNLNAYHVAGDAVKLADIYVEPRFLRAITPIDLEQDKTNDVLAVIPVIHDLPFSYAPYNVATLSLPDLQSGENHLALLGLPGSGKSTALAILGLFASNEIELATIDLTTDEVLESEIKDLPPDEKAKVIKQRQEIQQRALEHLKQAQAKDEEAGAARVVASFEKLLPILVHLRDIDLRPEAFGVQAPADGKGSKPPATKTLDPAEPLVKALQRRANTFTASALPGLVYNRLTAGTCLVLIDGYEDLPEADQAEKLAWLKQFLSIYDANFIIVTGPAIGFDPLLNLGLTPIFLRAWLDTDFETLIQRWAVAWPAIAGTGRRRAAMPEERIIRRVATNNRGRVPLDITLKAWAAFAGDEQDVGRRGWYDHYVRSQVDQKETRAQLERLAAAILDQSGAPISRDKIKTLIATGADGKPLPNADDLVNKLTARSGLLIDWPSNSYGFNHPLILAFLASETLATADAAQIMTVIAKPAWELAVPFAAVRTPLDSAITQRLGSQPDLLYSSLFSIISWLPDAPTNAAWRAEVFKRLTAALLAPSQYPTVRERAMAALVAARDKNVMFIFKQALRSTDPDVRRLGAVGLGALGETDPIKDIAPMLTDPDPNVQLAAGMALGAIGSETALAQMRDNLLESEQPELRQAVAEALAAVPGEGYTILTEAVNSKDMQARRAAVFGLSRIKTAWALSLLYRAMLEDEQWYVRSAAEQAFREAEGLESTGAIRHPEADTLTWLIAWAAQKGEGVPAGPNARQVLIRVLQEGDPLTRAAAALTLANLGHVPALKPLYGALRDKDETVRAVVYQALGDLQIRLGKKLPAVV